MQEECPTPQGGTATIAATSSDCPGDPGLPPEDEPGTLKAGFSWGASRYHNRNGDRFPDPARTPEEVQAGDFPVVLDGCNSRAGAHPIVAYEWDLNGTKTTGQCKMTWQAPGKGQFPVALTVKAADGSRSSQTQLVSVRGDLLVASLGDSLGSGQGNPHSPKTDSSPATWEDTRCHRSAMAGSAQAASQLEGADRSTSITFVHLACSGAKIEEPNSSVQGGLLDPYEGQDDAFRKPEIPLLPPQVDELKRLVGGREIDALMLSIGINDVEFATIVDTCIRYANCERGGVDVVPNPSGPGMTVNRRPAMEEWFTSRLALLPARYDHLAAKLAQTFPELKRDPSRVFINQYPDPTHGTDGRICESMVTDTPIPWFGFHGAETRWAATVPPRLNEAVAAAAQKHGWTLVDGVAERYHHNGECADDPWFVRWSISGRSQGNDYGTMHPNQLGQAQLRIRFVDVAKPRVITPAPPQILVGELAPGGEYLRGVAPTVLVFDPSGAATSTVTLDGVPHASGTPITAAGAHTLVVDAANAAGLSSRLTIPFRIGAPEVASVTVAPTSVVGGTDARVTVQLNGTAPPGGVTVNLTSSDTGVASFAPASIPIGEGQSGGQSVVKTTPVAKDASVTISGTAAGGTPRTATLTVQAPRVTGFALSPSQVAGGTASTATVRLNGPAPAKGLSFTLATSNAAVVPATTVVVEAGQTTGQGPVSTNTVSEPVKVTMSITGEAGQATLGVFPTTVTVPILIGEGEEVAVGTLRDLGLTWELVGDHGQLNSKVLRQSPQGGKVVDFGTTVTLTMTTAEKI